MKIVKIDGDNLHVFWATWGLSMKFSEKNVAYDNIKSHKKYSFTLSEENTFFEKGGVKLLRPAFLGLMG